MIVRCLAQLGNSIYIIILKNKKQNTTYVCMCAHLWFRVCLWPIYNVCPYNYMTLKMVWMKKRYCNRWMRVMWLNAPYFVLGNLEKQNQKTPPKNNKNNKNKKTRIRDLLTVYGSLTDGSCEWTWLRWQRHRPSCSGGWLRNEVRVSPDSTHWIPLDSFGA